MPTINQTDHYQCGSVDIEYYVYPAFTAISSIITIAIILMANSQIKIMQLFAVFLIMLYAWVCWSCGFKPYYKAGFVIQTMILPSIFMFFIAPWGWEIQVLILTCVMFLYYVVIETYNMFGSD